MKRFLCVCGQRLYFENTSCGSCGRVVGFDPDAREMQSGELEGKDVLRSALVRYRLCANTLEYSNCNWLLPMDASEKLCLSCSRNRTIPNLDNPDNAGRWARIEIAKRRLIYTLMGLELPIRKYSGAWHEGLLFDFLEDQRSNPWVQEHFVTTGHTQGVITVNVLEADDAQRAEQQELMNENYRTLLGHFRHEAGHYYFDVLVRDANRLEEFRSLFGDESQDYARAVGDHYRDGPPGDWQSRYISNYAASHPHEDWAESFAHFLHITDALETAIANGWHLPGVSDINNFEDCLSGWVQLSLVLNEMNRSMGLADAYPFVITDAIRDKLAFVRSCF